MVFERNARKYPAEIIYADNESKDRRVEFSRHVGVLNYTETQHSCGFVIPLWFE